MQRTRWQRGCLRGGLILGGIFLLLLLACQKGPFCLHSLAQIVLPTQPLNTGDVILDFASNFRGYLEPCG